MIRRYLRWRLENLDASIVDWQGELRNAENDGRGNGRRGLECSRVLKRYGKKRDRIARILELLGEEVAE